MNEQLEELGNKYIEQRTVVQQETEKLDEIKARIKLALDEEGIEFFETGNGIHISHKESIRKGLDTKAVKEFLGEKANEFLKESTFSTLRVTTEEERENKKKFMS